MSVGIEKDSEGADLRISRNGETARIEVKGTKSKDIAWAKLKVSSRRSYDALRTGAASMYRVTDVDGSEPRVHILKHGRDYELKTEPRWAVKPAGERTYPLRGRNYRYELPHEAVALRECDPADRLIVATSRIHACDLVTSDEKIVKYPHVPTIA